MCVAGDDDYGEGGGGGGGGGVPDMTLMSQITETSINRNLRLRYDRDLIYTYTGSILVAVNPYKELGCYDTDHMHLFRGKPFDSQTPHVFALAEAAYSLLQSGEKNQSVVISGESGAGKTETTKRILQYLCAGGGGVGAGGAGDGRATWAEQQILEANTVLEAFGNAKTVRNDNSSRFGKFVEVKLDRRGGIRGAVLRDFLLERARITGPAPREKNYHVFYQLIEGTKNNPELRSALHLRDGVSFRYLQAEDSGDPPGEQGRLEALRLALTVLQVSPNMIEGLFKVLAAVLWLGNIDFEDIDGERTTLATHDAEAVRAAAALLGLAPATARRVLLERQINVRGNVTDIPLRVHEARENRHGMARALYARTFAWLVRHVNGCSAPGEHAARSLGVLDIFGFENFASNSLEQLCINYANEKLHMFFNNYVFALEQETYRQEGIVYNPIHFTDNSACLELLEKPPRSLLKLLSEQCHMPKGCDSAYLTNVQSEFGDHPNFVKGSRRKWEEEFGVAHYAGAVTYSVAGFVDKNRDTQQDAFIDHLSRSENVFVRELADYMETPQQEYGLSSPGVGTLQRGTAKGRPTVVDTFRCQLQSLVDLLQATDVWYVRCIKPNENKESSKYNSELVLEQLRYLGMLEIVRIRRDGYPVHLPTPEFHARYRCLLAATRVSSIMELVNGSPEDWQLGHTKVFMRSSIHAPLEARRTALIQASAQRIQKWYKGATHRRQYLTWRRSAVVLQRAWRAWLERAAFLRLRRAALTLQRHLRGVFAREVAAALREMRRVELEMRVREERNSMAERASKERMELESMADQLRGIQCPAARSESVNLDNLFDFLADVASQQRGAPDGQPASHQPTIAEIGDTMERLVGDLDQELEHVLASELINLKSPSDRQPDGAPAPAPAPLPIQQATPLSPQAPPTAQAPPHALPEPLGPPPPPPSETTPPERMNGIPTPLKPILKKSGEPIYAVVIPRSESIQNHDIAPPLSPPACVNNNDNNDILDNNVKLDNNENDKRDDYNDALNDFNRAQCEYNRAQIEYKKALEYNAKLNGAEAVNGENGCHDNERLGEHIYNGNGELFNGVQNESENNGFDQESALPPPPLSPQHGQPPCSPPPPPLMTQSVTSLSPTPLNGESQTGSESPERSARRRTRVERRLHQLESDSAPAAPAPAADSLHLVNFANQHFNSHPRSPDGTIMATLTRKNKSMEALSKEDMVTYHKGNNIPTSHIQLHDPDSVTAAVNIFRDLCRYMRGELTAEKETQVIQSIIGKGLEIEELRDEVLVQCVRQITDCPVAEWAERLWLLLCLVAVAWQPGRGLARYYTHWLRAARASHADSATRAAHCAQWCLDNCRGAAPRTLPPSTVEIAAMRRLGTIVCRFFFLDGRTKAIDVHPADTAAAAAARLADKLGLPPAARAGWAVYQLRPRGEQHVRAQVYLYDVIAAWEREQGAGGGSADNRFVFKRRLFRGGRELPHDPVEVALLYAQAVHSVVKLDEFPVSEKVALQLAGLQAQVSLGEPPPPPAPPHTRAYYAQPELFLPARVARTRSAQQWASILAQAHRQYGAGRAELTAKALYLSCVMQYPLYGVTLFPVTYKGYWPHGSSVLLGVGSEGIVLVRPADKVSLAEYRYSDMAAILTDHVDNGLTISLAHHSQQDGHRCIVLESPQNSEAAWLMASYCPALAQGLADEAPRRAAPAAERARLAGALRSARRAIVDSGLLRRPLEVPSNNFLRNTLKRLSKHRVDKPHADLSSESYKGFPGGYWAWGRGLPHSLTRLNEAEEVAAMQIFKDIMCHAGLAVDKGSTSSLANNNSTSSSRGSADEGEDRVSLAQALLQRCLQKDSLLAELYMQLIKQTTEHPEPASRAAARHWALLLAATGAALPAAKPLRRLLVAHLRYCGAALAAEQGKFARRAEQMALATASVPRRLAAPSKEEILCAAARRPLHVRVLLLDGKQHGLVFTPAATADHLVAMLREKIGLSQVANGYALYEVCASTPGGGGQRALAATERVGDVLARWEKAGATAGACRLVFKKRLFLGERPLHTACAAEVELLYHQVLHALRHDRLPVETDEAVMLAALHAQVVSGDCAGGGEDCSAAAASALPARVALPAPAVRLHHLALRGTPPALAMQRALNLAQSWPLTRATIFDVMQSFTSHWPRALWLAVDARGLTLLRHRSRAALVSYDHEQLAAVSPAPRALLLVTAAGSKHAKVVLTTDQAYQIATLIKDYIEAVRGPVVAAAPEARQVAGGGAS